MENNLRALFLEVTKRCNAFCDHCGSKCGRENLEDMELIYFKKALDEIASSYNPHSIMLYITGGEPLVRRDLFELTRHAVSQDFTWGLVTNGILLNKEKIDLCKKTNMSTISISIDGLPNTHDNFRHVEGAYNTIVNNIKELKKANFVEHIQITYTVTKQNIYELPEVYRNMCMLGVDSFRISNIDLIGRAKEHMGLLLDKSDFEFLFRFIKKHENSEVPICWSCTHYFGGSQNNFDGSSKIFKCYTGKNVASILYDGTIYGCPNIERTKRLEQGNIKTHNFVDVWENGFKIYRDESTLKSEKCKTCKHWNDCKGDSFHTFNFKENKQSFCYEEVFKGKVNNAIEKTLPDTSSFFRKVTPKSDFKKTVIISSPAKKEIFDYFRWGKFHPLNMYEQQMVLVGFVKDNNYVVEYAVPCLLLNRSGNMAISNDFCLEQVLDEIDIMNENLHKLKKNSVELLGFIHSHPCDTEFKYSSSDIENESFLRERFGQLIGVLINPQKEKIVAFDNEKFKQQKLIIL